MKTVFLFLSCLSISSSAFASIADLDDNHKIDLQDYAIFSTAWKTELGQAGYNPICDISSPPDQRVDLSDFMVFADHWDLSTIRVGIFSDGWGHYCDTVILAGEGNWPISFTDPQAPYWQNPTHYAYAYRDRYYTELCRLTTTQVSTPHPPDFVYEYSSTVNVDLDPIDPNKFNGTIFLTQAFFADSYLSNQQVQVYSFGPEPILEFTTDAQGRFAIDLPPDLYWIRFYEYPSDPYTFHEHEFIVSGDYSDFQFPACYQAMKPNIYIYPETTTEMTVQVTFPEGGTVIQSEPLYQNGWQVTVERTGLINQQFDFLFYESSQPDRGQYENGWVVSQSELEAFFRTNLAATGFNAKEIADFIEYWIPLLNDSPFYAIYPQYNQQLENMIHLSFSVPPKNVIRLMYSIRSLPNNSLVLPAPVIPPFCRDGFTVAEWGVMLK